MKRGALLIHSLQSAGPHRAAAVKRLRRSLRFASALRVTAPPRRGVLATMAFDAKIRPGAGFRRRSPWSKSKPEARAGVKARAASATREAGLALTPSTSQASAHGRCRVAWRFTRSSPSSERGTRSPARRDSAAPAPVLCVRTYRTANRGNGRTSRRICHRGQRDAAEMRADADHDQPFRLLHAVLVGLRVS